MALYDLKIPQFKALDFTPLTSMFDDWVAGQQAGSEIKNRQQNAETQRKFAENEDKKLSAQLARWQAEDQQKRDTLEWNKQMAGAKAIPDIMRMAATNPEMAQAMAAPYGQYAPQISIDQTKNLAPSDALQGAYGEEAPPQGAPVTPEVANEAQFLLKGAQPSTVSREDLLAAAPAGTPAWHAPMAGAPPYSGMPAKGEADWHAPMARPEQMPANAFDEADEGPRAEPDADADDQINADEAIAAREAAAPVTRQVYASFRGQRFPVKPTEETLTGEPEVDATYKAALAAGLSPKDAAARALTLRGQNLNAGARAVTADQRERGLMTPEIRQEMQDRALAQSEKNTNIAGEYRVRAAQASGNTPAALSKEQGIAMNALNQRLTQIRGIAGWNELAKQRMAMETLLQDVAEGTTPLQNKEAQVLTAKIVRGRVTDQEMRQLYDNLGGASGAFERFAANTLGGRLSPEQLRQLRASTAALLGSYRMLEQRARQVARAGLDQRTFGFMPDQAQAGYDMLTAELGIPSESITDMQGGIQPGAPTRGRVRPRAAAPAQPGAAAPQAPHPKQLPIGTRMPGPDGIMREKTAQGWVPVK